eukprot:403347749
MTKQQIDERVQSLIRRDRVAFSRTITLIESSREEDRVDADNLMRELFAKTPHRQNKAIRIGICGSPGAGKSSLIEKLGLYIAEELNLNLAVLTIDPSSQRSGGSILGDKTRMEKLSFVENAFIRPSPTRGMLGGLALNTGDVQQLCERTGYDAIVVETVGVGQSEIEIENVADFVVYVVPPGSGDGLQGAKKGIMEIADLVVINKYDTEYKKVCERLKRQIEGSLTLSIPKHNSEDFTWYPEVELVSAKQPFNVECIWNHANTFRQQMGPVNLQTRRTSLKGSNGFEKAGYSTQGGLANRFGTLNVGGSPRGGAFDQQSMMSGMGGDNTAHLKGKLGNLNETIRQLQEQLNSHKKEVQIMRSEKETLESVLTMKCQDTRKALTNELHRVEEEIKRHYNNQHAEGQRLQQQLTGLKTDKTALEKDVIRMQKRIEELELQIGHEDPDM